MKHAKFLFTMCIAVALGGCCTVKVPPKAVGRDREVAGKIAADLNDPKVQGELSVTYKSKIQKTYVDLSDKNVAFYLWLKAAECESKRGNKDLAGKIYTYAFEILKASTDTGRKALWSPNPEDYAEIEYLHKQWTKTMEAIMQ